MDISPQIKSSCLQYSSWKESDNECETYAPGMEVCCLAFRGDTSSTPIYNQPFNASDDMIRLLRSKKYRYLFAKNTSYPYNIRRYLQINFHLIHPMSDILARFLKTLLETIKELDLNIDFFTGTRAMIWDIQKACKLGNCTDDQHYIAHAPINLLFYGENPPSKFWKQQVTGINIFYGSALDYCKKGFPDWIVKYDFPIVFWEPSHEYQVQYVRNHYTDPECKIPGNYRSLEKMKISSNLEPEQLQIYWKTTVFNLNNTYNPSDQKAVIYGDFKAPNIEYVPYCDYYVFGFNSDGDGKIVIYDGKFNIIKERIFTFMIKHMRSQEQYLLLQSDTVGIVIEFVKNLDGTCQTIESAEFKKNAETVALSALSEEIVTFQHNYDNYTVTFGFIDIHTHKFKGQLIFDMGPVLRSVTLNLMFDSFYSPITKTYHIVLTFTKKGQIVGEKGVRLTNQIKIYLSTIELDQNYQILDYIPAIHHVDFGTTNDLKLYEINGTMYLLAVHTNGLCQCAILLNNNQWNKCVYENYEQYETISNVKNMINYIWGTLDAVKDRVRRGKKINGCDGQIMHAKIGNGAKPQATLVPKNGQYQAFIISEFIHFQEQAQFSKLFCGSSNDYPGGQQPGLQLFSFDLASPHLLKNAP